MVVVAVAIKRMRDDLHGHTRVPHGLLALLAGSALDPALCPHKVRHEPLGLASLPLVDAPVHGRGKLLLAGLHAAGQGILALAMITVVSKIIIFGIPIHLSRALALA